VVEPIFASGFCHLRFLARHTIDLVPQQGPRLDSEMESCQSLAPIGKIASRRAAGYSDTFIESNHIIVLKVGPRESDQPDVYAFALKMIRQYRANR
jgi:hypothetical protein